MQAPNLIFQWAGRPVVLGKLRGLGYTSMLVPLLLLRRVHAHSSGPGVLADPCQRSETLKIASLPNFSQDFLHFVGILRSTGEDFEQSC